MADAIRAGGGQIVPIESAEGLVWGDPHRPDALEAALDNAERVRWIQLPFAGIEQYVHLVGHDREWTCG